MKKIFLIFSFIFLAVIIFVATKTSAATCEETYSACVAKIWDQCKTSTSSNNDCSKSAGEKCLTAFQSCSGKSNTFKASGDKLTPLSTAYYKTKNPSLTSVLGNLIKIAITLAGLIFFLLILYGGYKWMLARGDSKEIDTAKNIITRSVIGLAIVFAAYAIAYFVIAGLTTGTGITIKS